MSPSWPYQFVAVLATTMLCASTILPITPPELLAALISTGLMPVCSAVIFCKLPNNTFDAVSEPAEHRAEEWIQASGLRQRQTQRGVGAGVARHITQRQHRRDGDEREAHA